MKGNMKQSIVQPYVFFDGKCEEALEFYKRALGVRVNMLMRYKDSPEAPPPGCGPTDSNKVMHANFSIGETQIMASDGRATGNPKFEGFALSLSLPTPADVDKAFNALANGGKIEMPLAKTFFSERFGMVVDKFGVFWMLLVTPEAEN
jgi:PhnB protein